MSKIRTRRDGKNNPYLEKKDLIRYNQVLIVLTWRLVKTVASYRSGKWREIVYPCTIYREETAD